MFVTTIQGSTPIFIAIYHQLILQIRIIFFLPLSLATMKMTKTFLAVAVAMAFSIAVTLLLTTATTTRREGGEEEQLAGSSEEDTSQTQTAVQTKRMSRFLAQDDYYPRPKYHRNKDNDVCSEEGSPGSTCCNNKYIDIVTDKKNCGACKNKYKYTESCYNGECVNLSFDKRHCGKCHNKCMQDGYCIYAMCDYA